jgi:uncharacterized protein involved in exopolysaccharide biosynthesis
MDNEVFDDYLSWYAQHQPANTWTEAQETAAESAWEAAFVRAEKLHRIEIERLKSEVKALKARVALLEKENSWLESEGR